MNVVSDSSSALKLFHEGQQEKALELALSTLRHCPLHSEHFAEMSHLAGACLYSLGQNTEALPYLRSAIKSNPHSAVYFNTFGVVQKRMASCINPFDLTKLSRDLIQTFPMHFIIVEMFCQIRSQGQAIDQFNPYESYS